MSLPIHPLAHHPPSDRPVWFQRNRPIKPIPQPCPSNLVPSSQNIALVSCHLPFVWSLVISRGFISAVRLKITVKQWLKIRQRKEPVLPETKQIQILASKRGEIRSVAQMVLTKSSWTLIREAKSTSDFLFWFLTPLFCCYTQTLMPPCAMGDAGSVDLIWGREGEKGPEAPATHSWVGDQQTVARLFQGTMWRLQSEDKWPIELS